MKTVLFYGLENKLTEGRDEKKNCARNGRQKKRKDLFNELGRVTTK